MEVKNKSEDSNDVGIGPYKATRLWNDVISAFRQGVPRGKHRRYMRTAENCFVGSAAVDWLLDYLKKDGRDVTRHQATQLLNKFYKAGIFEEIQVSRRGRNKNDFSDSNRLYRLLPASPSKGTRTPLAVRSLASSNIPANNTLPEVDKLNKRIRHKSGDKDKSAKDSNLEIGKGKEEKKLETKSGKLAIENLPQCHLVGRILSFAEISEVWKTAALSRLKKILGRSDLEDILQGCTVEGGNIRHNCIFLNKSGIVTNVPPEDHLPHWVLSAMKCLARWPEKVEGDLPSYPGFEKDVFSVVRDYFLGLPEPLIIHDLYDVVTNIYVQACNQLPRHSSPYAHTGRDRTRLGHSLWSATSLENIILNLTRKYCMTDSKTDIPGLADSHPDMFCTTDGQYERSCSHTNLTSMASTRMDLRGMMYSESDFFRSSKSHTNLYSMGAHHVGESYPDVYRLVESCGDLRLHSGQSTSDLHVVPERLGVSSMSVFPSSLTRSSGLGLSNFETMEGRKRFRSTPELQVAHYETAFGPDNQTVTRVYYCNGVATDYQHGNVQESDLYCPVETRFDVAPDANKSRHSAGHISFKHMGNKSGNFSSSCDHSKSVIEHSHCFTKLSTEVNTSRERQDGPDSSEAPQQNDSVSPVWATLPKHQTQRRSRAEGYNTMGGTEFVFGAHTENRKLNEVGRHLSASTPYLPGVQEEDKQNLPQRGNTNRVSSVSTSAKRSTSLFMNFPRSSLCEERAAQALQVVLLFMPPASRRKLHFLLRLLSKMAANPFLMLDPSQSTRSLVLGTFQRAVLQSREEGDLDEVLVLQLMSFLMDHHMDILAVPTDMKDAVENRLQALEKPQIVYTACDSETVRFCQPMSVQQYEATTQDHSHKALVDLLDSIVRDQNMQEKEKHRRLKQFQKTYPQIYKKRFPSAESDPLQTDTRLVIKPPLLAKPLMKLRGLRV